MNWFQPMVQRASNEKVRRILVFLVPFVYLAVLSNSITGELFWSDDPEEIEFVRNAPLGKLLFGPDVFGYFRPVKNILWIAFACLAPFGIEWCHVLAISIGILSFFCVRSLCRRIFENEWKALAAAMAWLLSPTLVSSVAWLSGINIQTMVAFASLSIVFHDKAWNGETIHPFQVATAGVFLFLALVSYECAVSVPFILIAFDWYLRPNRVRNRTVWLSHAFYWGMVVLYFVLRGSTGAIHSASGRWIQASRGQLIFSSPYFTFRHFADWFWPFGSFSVGGSYVWGEVSPVILAGCAFFGIAVIASAFLFKKRFPALCFCVVFAILGFSPTSNCLGFGNGPFGDYYICLASIGLSAGVVEAIHLLAGIRGSWRVPAATLSILFVLVRIAAIPEAARWAYFWSRSDLAYEEGIRSHPESLQNQLALLRNVLFIEGRWDEALDLGRRIEEKVGPDSPFMQFVYCTRVVYAIVVDENKELACEMIKRFDSVSSDPAKESQILFYEGLIAEKLDGDEAIAEQKYKQALAGKNDKDIVVSCITALARIKSNHGEWNMVVPLLEQALAINPDSISLSWNLVNAYRKAGTPEKGDALLKFIRKKTGNPDFGKEEIGAHFP